MAVPEQTPYIEYSANGISKKFSVPFQCLSKNTLIVSIDGVETLPQLWDFNSGEIIFITAPLNNSIVSIKRSTHLKREVSYNSFTNSMLPTVFNGDFDRIWHTLQEQSYKLGQYDFDYSYAVNTSNQANQKSDQANQKADLALEGLETVSTETQPILRGGTGATTAEDARNNLDVYSQAEVDALIATGGSGNIIGIENGGTGAETAEDARTNLDVYSTSEVNTAISSSIPPETPNATETIAGKAEIATQAEANTGTNDATIITPKKLKSVNDALPLFTSAQNVVDVTASRTSGTIYTNVNKPKFIAIDVNNSSTGDSVLFQKDNAGNWIGMGVRGSGTRTVYALILPLHQYKYESATTFSKWVETVV